MTLSAGRVEFVHHLPPDYLERSLRADVYDGLTGPVKSLPPRWFYDKRGSDLFEQITRLPEYYPARAEREVLHCHAEDIASETITDTLIELGSGSSRKTPVLIEALQKAGSLHRYVGVDVSDTTLLEASIALSRRFPDLELQAVAADFGTQLQLLPRHGRRMVAFLGGTIGNLEPSARAHFLREIKGLLTPDGGSLLLGTDLVKSPEVLVPAYDDAAGVTADFNRNVLRVLNSQLGADFDVEAFEHVAAWLPEQEWIEMRLRASRAMTVRVRDLDLEVYFEEGEEMRTEISAKFRVEGVATELAAARLSVVGQWTDSQNRYAMTLAETD